MYVTQTTVYTVNSNRARVMRRRVQISRLMGERLRHIRHVAKF